MKRILAYTIIAVLNGIFFNNSLKSEKTSEAKPAAQVEINSDSKEAENSEIRPAEIKWLPEDYKIENAEGNAEKALLYIGQTDGTKFTLEYYPEDNLEPYHGESLKKFKNLIESIKIYKIESLHFLVKKSSMEAHVIPNEFMCSEKDLTKNIPAGIFFSQSGSLTYNFRITMEQYFIRISGVFISEESMCEKTENAMLDPKKQANQNDPALLSARLEGLADEIEKQELETLRLKYALVSKLNKGFFGAPKPPDKKMIKELLKIKRKDPSITDENLLAELKNKGISVSSKEFELIMEIYFPDYQ